MTDLAIRDHSMPRLASFIRSNIEPILVEWEAFARAVPGAESMDITALRDHAKEMLQVIALDLEQPQSATERSSKSKGRADAEQDHDPTAAQEHGAGRAESGFSVSQMVAEFRALRASVIHLWTRRRHNATSADLEDMIRFNEAIDQAIAESITAYANDVNEAKDRFLAILGHDLRTPLGAILTSASFMIEYGSLAQPNVLLLRRIEQSTRRMNQLVSDLLEYTRSRFGDSLPMNARPMDLEAVLRDVASEVRAANPSVDLRLSVKGPVRGSWDCDRLTQALVNLVTNAVQHGDLKHPVTVHASSADGEALVSVHNQGAPIPADQVAVLFDPMKASAPRKTGDRRHLGLGLYIVDRIVKAHGGRVDVSSSKAEGTSFTLRLPANGPNAAT
jgi:signal transduction histidine kinase